MMEQAKLKVFLCHASQDKPIVRDVYRKLSSEGWIDPWLDEEKILAGQEWEYEIEKAVEAADIVIVFLSTTSVNKEGYIQKELRYALDIALEKPEGAIFIIPIRLDDCIVPRKIKHWQYIDCFPVERFDWYYKKLLESLRVRGKSIGLNMASMPATNGGVIDFGSIYDRRMPVYFLIECDDSMKGVPIMAIEQGLQLLHNELLGQPQAIEMVNLSVIVYSTVAQQIIPLSPIMSFAPPTLSAGGVRNLGNAFRVLGNCISREVIRNIPGQKGDFKVLVFWVTGGEPTDEWESGLNYFRESTNGLLGSLNALVTGDAYNINILNKITSNIMPMIDLTPDKMHSFFKWVSQSVVMKSKPVNGNPLPPPSPPDEFQVVL